MQSLGVAETATDRQLASIVLKDRKGAGTMGLRIRSLHHEERHT